MRSSRACRDYCYDRHAACNTKWLSIRSFSGATPRVATTILDSAPHTASRDLGNAAAGADGGGSGRVSRPLTASSTSDSSICCTTSLSDLAAWVYTSQRSERVLCGRTRGRA